MCSKPVVNTVARVTSGVLTLGGSEVARNNLSSENVLNKTLNTPGDILTAGQSGDGLLSGGMDAAKKAIFPMPEMPQPGSADAADTQADPMPHPGSTSVESLQARRRKRLAALQSGFSSTIATGPGGASGSPTLVSPTAGGLKLKLGA